MNKKVSYINGCFIRFINVQLNSLVQKFMYKQTNMSMRVYVRTHIHTCRWLSYPHDMYIQTHCHTYSRLSKSIGIVRCMCPEIGKEKIVASNAVETYITFCELETRCSRQTNEECFRFTHPFLIVFVPPIRAHAPSNRPFDRFIHLNGFGLKWRAFPCMTFYSVDLSLVVSLSLSVFPDSPSVRTVVVCLICYSPFLFVSICCTMSGQRMKKSTSTDFQDHYRVKRKFEFVFYLLRIWIFFLNV